MTDHETLQAPAPEDKGVHNGKGSGEKPKKDKYTGEKHPMLAMKMLKTSTALNNALKRIKTRREWIRARYQAIEESFDTLEGKKRAKAVDEVKALNESVIKLNQKEPEIQEAKEAAVEAEKKKHASLELPKLGAL